LIETRYSFNASRVGSDVSLHQILKVAKKWRTLIILFTLFCGLLAGLVSYLILSPVYQAKTLLMVTVASEKLQTQTAITRQVSQNSQGATVTNVSTMPVLTMNTYLGQLMSEEVMKRVVENSDLPGQSVGSLSAKIDASIVPDSNLIEVTVEDENPETAYKIANALSEQYLKLMEEFMFSSVVVISPANIPEYPVKPNKKFNIAVALLGGLIISFLLAYVLEYMDNTLKTPEDVNRELNLSVLGLIPLRTSINTRQDV